MYQVSYPSLWTRILSLTEVACSASHNRKAIWGSCFCYCCTLILPFYRPFSICAWRSELPGKESRLLRPLLSYLGRGPISPCDTCHEPHPCLPALRKAVMASSTAVLRSKAPAWAPCHNMANSPDTWYTARGSSGCCREWHMCSSDCPFLPAQSEYLGPHSKSLLLTAQLIQKVSSQSCSKVPMCRSRRVKPAPRQGWEERALFRDILFLAQRQESRVPPLGSSVRTNSPTLHSVLTLSFTSRTTSR